MKLAIFDLDGTLLNTIEDLAISVNYALQKFAYPPHKLEEYCFLVGNGITKLIERALSEKERTEENIVRVRKVFMDYYSGHNTDFTKPYPGIVKLLEDLRHRGIILAVASNKYHEATQELVRFYFASGMFDIVRGQREGIPVKPDPSIVFEILSLAGVEKEDALYIGDSGVDMQTAVNSGVMGVGVTWGFRPRQELIENGASCIVEHPSEVTGLLK